MTQPTSSLNFKEKFPKFREELLVMSKVDQDEIRGYFHAYSNIKSEDVRKRKYAFVARNCHARAKRALEILDEIKDPTIENLGVDGCEAFALVAMHSYLEIMKRVLDVLEINFIKNRANIYYQSIPALKDRVLILEHKKQLYGTQWMVDKDEKPFLIAVEDFSNMNLRRSFYGLDPARRPVNLAKGAKKYPLGKGLAKESDQKQLTKEEYDNYSRHYLKSEYQS